MFDVGDRIIGLELPDTFYKLAELLEQDQFELLLSKNRIKICIENRTFPLYI